MKETFETIVIEVVFFTDSDVICGQSPNYLPPVHVDPN